MATNPLMIYGEYIRDIIMRRYMNKIYEEIYDSNLTGVHIYVCHAIATT